MDRELLLEIGCEELPASWLPGLTQQIGEVVLAQLRDASAGARGAGRNLQHAAPADRPHRAARRAADRSRGTGQRAARSRPASRPTARRRRRRPASPRSRASRCQRSSASRRRRASTSPSGRSSAARPRSTCCRTCSAGTLRGLTFPKLMHWDAHARGRPRRAAVRPADPLDPVHLRRPRRAVQHRAHAGGAERPGAGRDVRRGHLRPPLPHDQRPRRPRDQGPHRSTSTAPGCSRTSSSSSAASATTRSPASSTPRRSACRAASAASSAASRGCSTRCPIWSNTRRSSAGTFALEFLELPEEVLTTTLIHHQHYFPVEGEDGRLKNAFLAVINTEPDNERTIARNAERVVTARLRDARFFWEADRKATLESRLDRLGTLLFHKKLGSYREKAERIEPLARLDCRRSAGRRRADGRLRRAGGAAGEGRPDDRHGARVHRAPGHDGRHLRARGRAARGGLEGDLLPLPADRRRGRRAAVARAAGQGGRHVGGRVAGRQARHDRRAVRGRREADRLARSVRPAPRGPGRRQDPGRPRRS